MKTLRSFLSSSNKKAGAEAPVDCGSPQPPSQGPNKADCDKPPKSRASAVPKETPPPANSSLVPVSDAPESGKGGEKSARRRSRRSRQGSSPESPHRHRRKSRRSRREVEPGVGDEAPRERKSSHRRRRSKRKESGGEGAGPMDLDLPRTRSKVQSKVGGAGGKGHQQSESGDSESAETSPMTQRTASQIAALSHANLPSKQSLLDLRRELVETFGELDADGNNEVDMNEFLQGAHNNGRLVGMLDTLGITTPALKEFFAKVDKDHNTAWELDEFLEFFEDCFLQTTFRLINTAGDGMMSRKEFRGAVSSNAGFADLVRGACAPVSDTGSMYDRIDRDGNGNGYVSEEEFVAFFKRHLRKLLDAERRPQAAV